MKYLLVIFLMFLVGCSESATITDNQPLANETQTYDDTFNEVCDYVSSIHEQSTLLSFTVHGQKDYLYMGYQSATYYLQEPLVVKTDFITKNTNARPGIKRDIKYIVVHDTGNTSSTAGAVNHAEYLKNNLTQYVSWHYTVDNEYIIQHIPDDEIAWHAGDSLREIGQNGKYLGGGNLSGIGIEMAINEGSDIILTWQKTAKLVASLLVKYNLSFDDVLPHQAFANKVCPETILRSNMWDLFMNYVHGEYEMITSFGNFSIKYVDDEITRANGRKNSEGTSTVIIIDSLTKKTISLFV